MDSYLDMTCHNVTGQLFLRRVTRRDVCGHVHNLLVRFMPLSSLIQYCCGLRPFFRSSLLNNSQPTCGNVRMAIPNMELKLERTVVNIAVSPGLGLRLGLLKSQARPKPTPSPCPGQAWLGLERAGLNRLRA
jgi:hypothetical protein